MIEIRVIEINENDNEIECETQTQTTNMNIDFKKVAFATTVPANIDVADGTNEEVPVVNNIIVGSLESPPVTQSAQRDPPESSNRANKNLHALQLITNCITTQQHQ